MWDRRREEEERARRRAYLLSPMDAKAVMEMLRGDLWFAELSEEEVARLEAVLTRVEAVAKTLGRDFNLKLAPGEDWAYDFETNTLTVPRKHLLELPAETVLALAIHEAGHRRMSRLVSPHLHTPESRRLLINAVEDPRVNEWMMREYQGVRRKFFRSLYDRLYPESPRSPALKALGRNLPHVQFVLGLIYYWVRGRECPSITHPSVVAALKSTRKAVRRAWRCLPDSPNPTEREIWEKAKEALGIVVEEVWPVYQELVEESVEMVERGLREGTIRLAEEGLPLGLSEDELPELARKLVEEASAEIADVLGGKLPRPDLEQAGITTEEIGPPGKPGTETEEGIGVGPQAEEGGEAGEGAAVEVGEEGEGLSGTITDWFRKRRAELEALERYKEAHFTPYGKYLDRVAREVEELAGFLEAILLPNAAPRREGYFRSGTAVDIRRLMQRKASGVADRDIFLRRIRPTRRDYRFSLLLDESGSMSMGRKDFNAICATVLFVEVLERLGIPHEVAGFHSTHLVHKGYHDALTASAKEEMVREIERSMGQGATHDVEAVGLALDRLAEEAGEVKCILVITDGEGNGPGNMEDALDRARREGVRVIGVGVGEGVDHVQHQYEEYVLVPRISDLPSAIGGKLEEVIVWG